MPFSPTTFLYGRLSLAERDSFFTDLAISQIFSSPYTLQLNGVVERRNRSLCEAARTMLTYANFPQYFCAEAVSTVCFTQNRSFIHLHFNITPYEIMNKRKPNVKFFHVFGCRCFIMNLKDNLSNFQLKADEGVFLGYSISKFYNL